MWRRNSSENLPFPVEELGLVLMTTSSRGHRGKCCSHSVILMVKYRSSFLPNRSGWELYSLCFSSCWRSKPRDLYRFVTIRERYRLLGTFSTTRKARCRRKDGWPQAWMPRPHGLMPTMRHPGRLVCPGRTGSRRPGPGPERSSPLKKSTRPSPPARNPQHKKRGWDSNTARSNSTLIILLPPHTFSSFLVVRGRFSQLTVGPSWLWPSARLRGLFNVATVRQRQRERLRVSRPPFSVQPCRVAHHPFPETSFVSCALLVFEPCCRFQHRDFWLSSSLASAWKTPAASAT
jgi:hypothetical protein